MCLGILGWQILIELKRMTCQCTNLQGKEQISSCIAGKIVFEKHRQTSPTQELTEETGFIYTRWSSTKCFYVSPISLFCIKWNPEKSKDLHTIFLGSQSPLQLKIMDVGIIWQLDMWLTSYLDLDSSLFKLCIFVLFKLLHQMWPALFWRIPLC